MFACIEGMVTAGDVIFQLFFLEFWAIPTESLQQARGEKNESGRGCQSTKYTRVVEASWLGDELSIGQIRIMMAFAC